MRPRLGLNVDAVAGLRQMGEGRFPDPVEVALLAEQAGADQIAVNLRDDRSTVQVRDVELLRASLKTEFHLGVSLSQDNVHLALNVRPDSVTLLPTDSDSRQLEGGALDFMSLADEHPRLVRLLDEAGIRVVGRLLPNIDQVRAAHRLGVHAVQISSGEYTLARGFRERTDALQRLRETAKAAAKLNMPVAISDGLDRSNIGPLVHCQDFSEFWFGHTVLGRAIGQGLDRVIRDIVAVIRESSN